MLGGDETYADVTIPVATSVRSQSSLHRTLYLAPIAFLVLLTLGFPGLAARVLDDGGRLVATVKGPAALAPAPPVVAPVPGSPSASPTAEKVPIAPASPTPPPATATLPPAAAPEPPSPTVAPSRAPLAGAAQALSDLGALTATVAP